MYYKKDCVELSMQSYTISATADNYEEVRSMLKAQSGGKIISPGNRFFNEGPKDFKRPGMAIDREVFSCHPPKIESTVRRIIGEFRAGALDEVPIWMDKNGKCMLVRYMAVRDKEGKYLGTLELVQDMGFAKEHFQPEKRQEEIW